MFYAFYLTPDLITFAILNPRALVHCQELESSSCALKTFW